MNGKMISNVDFDFGVITYNSSPYIIELLESIKYQIKTFGKGKNVELIIGDDGSKDNTVEMIEQWIHCNEDLFYKTNLIKNEYNKGTVINVGNVVDSIQSKYFHVIAGDDLYNNLDVFSYTKKLEKYDILTSFPYSLNCNGELFIENNRLLRRIELLRNGPYSKQQLLEKEAYGSMIHSPSTFFKKVLLTNNVKSFKNEFFLLDDDPTWIKFFEITNNIFFDVTPIIIYRYHDKSVSHSDAHKIFKKDLIKLLEYYLECNISLKYKLFVNIKLNDIKADRQFIISNGIRFLESLLLRLKYSLNDEASCYYESLTNQIISSQQYYAFIKRQAQIFYRTTHIYPFTSEVLQQSFMLQGDSCGQV